MTPTRPSAGPESAPEQVETLDDSSERSDLFPLNEFGVLNIGEEAISGVIQRTAGLQTQAKRCPVLTNAAGEPNAVLMARYHRLGYVVDLSM